MTFLIVCVNLTAFLIPGRLVGAIAKGLILGETAQADPNGFFLRFYLERSLIGFEDGAHWTMVKIKEGCCRAAIASGTGRWIAGNICTEDRQGHGGGSRLRGARALAERGRREGLGAILLVVVLDLLRLPYPSPASPRFADGWISALSASISARQMPATIEPRSRASSASAT